MNECVEKQALKSQLKLEADCGHVSTLQYVFDIIDFIPAADVRPVVHGRFVHDGPRFAGGVDWWHCSNCGSLVSGVETRFAFCPHCGADMRGGGGENEAD